MKIINSLSLFFYFSLLLFINFISNDSVDSNIFKLILFLACIGTFILLGSFFVMLIFNKKYQGLKLHVYFAVSTMTASIVLFLVLGHNIYVATNSVLWLNGFFFLLFLGSRYFEFKIGSILKKHHYNVMDEVNRFFKMGNTIEGTPLYHSIARLDRFIYVYIIGIVIIENIYYFAGLVVLILLFSTKQLGIIKYEFMESGLISVKEAKFSIFSYYFFYLISIGWFYFFPNLSLILIVSASELLIKIYMHRIAVQVYDEKNKE